MLTARTHRIGIMLAIALVAALLVPARASAADELFVAPTLSAAEKDCESGSANTVIFGGSATPGATIAEAWLREHDAEPNPGPDGSDSTVVAQRTVKSFIELSAEGTISGSYTLTAAPAGDFLSLVVIVSKDSASLRGHSLGLPVDSITPQIIRYETISTKQVRVVFNEEVTNVHGDSTLDWRVDDALPTDITGTGSNRILTVPGTLGEDQRPFLKYTPFAGRAVYRDCFGTGLSATGRFQTAVDKILPRIPNITEIGGGDATDGFVASKNRSASVLIGNVTNGHKVTLWRESGANEGWDTGDVKLGETTAAGGEATIPTGTLADNTNHDLYATAVDPSGNRSSAADHVVFRTDNRAPLTTVAQTTGTRVTIAFTEPVTQGSDDPSHWQITVSGVTKTITNVTSAGSTRVLHTEENIPNGSSVSYLGGAGYADEAGNELAPFSNLTATGFVGTVLDLVPETATIPVKGSHALTATVRDDNHNPVPGYPVVVRAVSGPASNKAASGGKPAGFIGECFSGSDGTCTIGNFSSNTVGVDRLQGWIDTDENPLTIEAGSPEPRDADDEGSPNASSDAKNQDVVEVSWVAEGVDLVLDAADSAASVPAERQISIAAAVVATDDLGRSGTAVAGVTIAGRVTTGANLTKPIESCQTNASGNCSLTYVGTNQGDDTIQLWIDKDENGEPNEASTPERGDADGLPALDDPNQDVIGRTWLAKAFPVLFMSPKENNRAINTNEVLAMNVIDTTGVALSGENVDARVVSGPNAGKYLGECTTPTNGRCSISYKSTTAGTDIVQAWIDANGNDIPDEATEAEPVNQNEGVNEPDQELSRIVWFSGAPPSPSPTATSSPSTGPSPTPGTDPSPSPGASTSPSPTPSTSPTSDPGDGDPGARALSATTEFSQVPAGSCQSVFMRLTEDGAPMTGQNIDATLSNANLVFCDAPGAHSQGTTDSEGEVVFRVSSPVGGKFEMITWHDENRDDQLTTGEIGRRVKLSWALDGTRTLSLKARKVKNSNKKVRLSGRLDAVSPSCETGQVVKIVRKVAGKKAKVVRRKATNDNGRFAVKLKVRRTAKYFVRAGKSGGCHRVRSSAIKIRAR